MALVSTQPARLAGPRDALAAIEPIVPTTQREFARTDRVTTFLRVYQGAQTPLAPATLAIAIRDAQDRVVVDATQTLDSARFDVTTRAADVRYELPLGTLQPGEHLLTFDTARDRATAKRHVRFRVR